MPTQEQIKALMQGKKKKYKSGTWQKISQDELYALLCPKCFTNLTSLCGGSSIFIHSLRNKKNRAMEEDIKKMIKEGCSRSEIARKYNLSPAMMCYYLKKIDRD